LGEHDQYGKRLLRKFFNDKVSLVGPDVEVWLGAGRSGRLDAYVPDIAIEIESRTSKQVRGAVLDLVLHPASKKLLLIIPIHMSNPGICAKQCEFILEKLTDKPFQVVILSRKEIENRFETDLKILETTFRNFEKNDH